MGGKVRFRRIMCRCEARTDLLVACLDGSDIRSLPAERAIGASPLGMHSMLANVERLICRGCALLLIPPQQTSQALCRGEAVLRVVNVFNLIHDGQWPSQHSKGFSGWCTRLSQRNQQTYTIFGNSRYPARSYGLVV